MHGFAKRVDDAVARAMSFLRAKGMDGAMASPSASNPDTWQALAKWKEPASVRWQPSSTSRGIAVVSRRPQTFGPVLKSHWEQQHQSVQRM
jgi:hypothetical protein